MAIKTAIVQKMNFCMFTGKNDKIFTALDIFNTEIVTYYQSSNNQTKNFVT